MDKPFYEFEIRPQNFRYEFKSSGHKEIDKVVLFQNMEIPNYYNLVLADILKDGSIDDLVESNNGDMETILSTVIQIIFAFLTQNPKAKVYFTGSDLKRTRLYNIILSKEYEKLVDFEVKGLRDNKLYKFIPNTTFDAFVISKKNFYI